uniref:Uncharacterized protein n=1 Tax=Acrobeloides nanus TaxID=290746 RepID=A0A914DVH9_9BILA
MKCPWMKWDTALLVCTPPENSAGLIVTAGTISARIDKTSLPVDTAYNKSSAAFIIDSNGYCPDLCIRGEDGKFYEPLNDNFYVEFLSFCDDHGCHMYAAVYEDKGDPLIIKNGPTIHMPNTHKSSVGTNTTYLKAVAVSCFTCADIKNEHAFGPTVRREQKFLLPYPTLFYTANGTNLTLIDVLQEDIVGDAPGIAYNVITEFCEMASEALAEALAEALEEALAEVLAEALAEALDEALVVALAEALEEALAVALAEALAEVLAEALAEALEEALAVALAEALAEVLAEALAEVLAEALAEALEEALTVALAEALEEALAVALAEVLAEALAEALEEALAETLAVALAEALT